MENKRSRRDFSRKKAENTSSEIPDLFRRRLQHQRQPNQQLKRYYRMLRRDKRVGSTAQTHFDRITQERLDEVSHLYIKTTKTLFRLAQNLIDGAYGERLQIAAASLTDSLFTPRPVLFLHLIDSAKTEDGECELFSLKDKQNLSKQLKAFDFDDITTIALGNPSDFDDAQKGLWNELNEITTNLDIPFKDFEVLIRIFKGFVSNFASPSHLSVEMMLDAEQNVDQTIQAALDIKNKEEKTRSLVQIVNRLLSRPNEGDIDKAIEVIQAIENESDRAKPLMKLIDKLSEAPKGDLPNHNHEIPFDKVKEIIHLAEKMEASSQRHKALQRIAIGLAKHNRPEEALQVMELISSQDARAYAKSSSVHMLVLNKKFADALWLLDHIKEPAYREDSINYIVKGYLEEERYDEAFAFVEGLESSVECNRAAKVVLNATLAAHDSVREKMVRERFSLT